MTTDQSINGTLEKLKLKRKLLVDIELDCQAFQQIAPHVIVNRPATVTPEFTKLQSDLIEICDRLITEINDIKIHINE
jgi:hypothetical protein